MTRRAWSLSNSFLLDALLEEQEQNITIDTTQIQFRTAKRNYVIIDAPGHKEFLKNMITGAASADAAVLLIAANEGVREQSRRHGYLLSLLGIKQVIIAVNKMDLVDWSEEKFNALQVEYTEFLKQVGLEAKLFIPVSARNGDNVQARSTNTPWYTGPTILDALDRFQPPASVSELPLRFPVQDVYRFDERRIIAGRVESGDDPRGRQIDFLAEQQAGGGEDDRELERPAARIRGGRRVDRHHAHGADLRRARACGVARRPRADRIEPLKANLFWMGKKNLEVGPRYKLKLTTQEIDCEVVSVDRVIDASTLETVGEKERKFVARNDVAEITIQTRGPLVLDNHDVLPIMGRFVIVDDRDVAGGGIIFGGTYVDRKNVRSDNIFWYEGDITSNQRTLRNGHKGAVVWLTGLSGSGKSTISRAVEREIFKRNMHTYVLDGDNIRHGLNANLGFSPEDREENIRRVAEVARLMADSGLIVITAFISPYRADRDRAREIVKNSGVDFVEVFVDAPLAVCEERDPKNLYKKARAGEIKEFTGIDAPYEAPENPEITVHTDKQPLTESVTYILDKLLPLLSVEETTFEI